MSRRTWLLAVLLLVALVLIVLARRDPTAQPAQVAPPSAEAPAQPVPSAATEALADPSERASIAEPAPKVAPDPTAPGHDEGGGKPIEVASREATTELFGRVQEPDGQSVADFRIEVLGIRDGKGKSLYSSKPIHSPTGEFRIQFPSYAKSSALTVVAFATGFDPGGKKLEDVYEGSSTDVGAIEMKPLRAALEGIVEDALTKKPIAGAHLEVLCDPPGEQRGVDSDAAGKFQFSVPPDEVVAAVSVWADGYAPRVVELGFVEGVLHVELSGGATIHGHVEFVGEAKLGELRVVCWEQQGRSLGPEEPTHLRGAAKVNDDGSYELSHVAPVPLYIGLIREVRGGGRREIYHGQIQMVLPIEGQKSDVDFRTGGHFSIRSHLQPQSNGLVVGRLFDASGALVSTTETLSGGDLNFLDVPAGRYEIRVCKVDPEHYLARSVEIGSRDLNLGDWDITDLPRKK